jgi:sialic acid synthase SpsE
VVLVIAEIGSNHGGSLKEAKHMIRESKKAGADAVKFQLYHTEDLGYSGDLYHQVKNAELTPDNLNELKQYCDALNMEFLCTPFIRTGFIDILEQINVERFKIRCADRNDKELISKAINTGKQVIISCDFIDPNNRIWSSLDNICLMYCIPEYPPKVVVMPQLFNTFEGYSNHYPSIAPPLAAAARGAKILEVHVKQKGTTPIDDAVSITFEELTELVRLVREMEEVVR